MNIHPKSIVILDFGGQYAHLIASRVRRMGVFSEIRDPETPAEELKDAAGIILSGGPQSVYDPDSPQGDPAIFELGIPVLGICYGLHWLTKTLGGEVKEGQGKEYGPVKIRNPKSEIRNETVLFKDCPDEVTVWMSHGDEAKELPEGFVRTATSESCANAAFEHPEKKFFALQFHPEVTHSEYGEQMLQNFVNVCDAAPWSMTSYAEQISEEIKKEVGDRNVFILVSGGVDSTVAFTLLNKVLGTDRVQGLYVDTGLMRKDETPYIKGAFEKLGMTNLRIEDASSEFFAALDGLYAPEEKRVAIGNTFLDVQRRVSEEMGLTAEDGWMLGQGTIYPDTVETGRTKHAAQIKTHHNRVEAVERLIEQGLVIEPLKDLYKDEVRALGEELGLPHELVWRHPFPGPGLGVRILCAEKPEPIANCQLPTAHASSVLPIKSVGVQGDGRTYRHALAVFVDEQYVITDELIDMATEIPNKNAELNRVLLTTSHSEVPTFTFSPGFITKERADLLREADKVVDDVMRSHDLYETIWQFPVVLLPFGTSDGGQSIVLRPIDSTDVMSASAIRLSPEVLEEMTTKILAIQGIDMVFMDLTNKPPGTVEWE